MSCRPHIHEFCIRRPVAVVTKCFVSAYSERPATNQLPQKSFLKTQYRDSYLGIQKQDAAPGRPETRKEGNSTRKGVVSPLLLQLLDQPDPNRHKCSLLHSLTEAQILPIPHPLPSPLVQWEDEAQ